MGARRRTVTPHVEGLLDRIAFLVAERQRLRAEHADVAILERNRDELARCQRELSSALIARHAPTAAQDAA